MASQASLAAVAVGTKETALQEFALPDIPVDGGLLRVMATGICGSDWPMYLNAKPGPRILGHEMVGVVERIGDAARDRWGVTEGDLVALEEYLPCGHCEDCRRGDFRACRATDSRNPNAIRYGSTPVARAPALWGGYSQYLYLHPRSMFHRVPAGVPHHIAAMALPIGNGFQWVHFDGQAGPGKTVLIQGPGQQGLGCVVAAKACGAERIIVSGLARDAHRFSAAMALGADHTVAVDEASLHDEVKRVTGGAMADIVIDCSGGGPDIINASLDLTARGGIFMIAARKWAPVPNFDIDKILTNRMSLKALRGHSFQAVEMALQAMAAGKFPLERMSSHVIGLADVDHGLRMMGGESREPSIHITVDPWKT